MKYWDYEEATERVYMASYVANRLGIDTSLNEISSLVDEWDNSGVNPFLKKTFNTNKK
jgi:hypothetical protein